MSRVKVRLSVTIGVRFQVRVEAEAKVLARRCKYATLALCGKCASIC